MLCENCRIAGQDTWSFGNTVHRTKQEAIDGAIDKWIEGDLHSDVEPYELDELQEWVAEGVEKGAPRGKTLRELGEVPSKRELKRLLEDKWGMEVKAHQKEALCETCRRKEGIGKITPGEMQDIRLQEGAVYFFGTGRPKKIILSEVGPDRVTYYRFDGRTGEAKKQSEQKAIFKDLAAEGSKKWLKKYGKYHPDLATSLKNLLDGKRGTSYSVRQYIEGERKVEVLVEPTLPDDEYDRNDPWYSAESYGNVGGVGDNLLKITTQRKDVPEIEQDRGFEILEVDEV